MRDKILVMLLSFFLLAAWGDVQLYSALSEKEANEILYVLLSHDISSSKSSEKAGFTVTVDAVHLAQAINLLRAFGLPRRKFVDLGDVFSQQGLVASPTEEKARFIYATSQELSETISNIDGVIISRVHIVLPTENTVGEVLFPSSASVFIKYSYGADVAALVPKIKLLVANSIEGLKEKEVSVTLFEADMVHLDSIPLQSVSYFWFYFAGGVIVVVLLVGAGVLFWFWKKRQNMKSPLGDRRVDPIQTVKNKLRDSASVTPVADTATKTASTTVDNQTENTQASKSNDQVAGTSSPDTNQNVTVNRPGK